MKVKMQLIECGCCCCFHPVGFDGDCREDANRYADAEDFAERNGVSAFDIEVLPYDFFVDRS
jgi:hypothetical protein